MAGAPRTQSEIVAGNTAHTQPENRLHYPALDGVRAVAFLITGILFDTRAWPHRFRNFYVQRVLRNFPLYFGLLLLIFALTPITHWRWNWYWLAWPLFLDNLVRLLRGESRERLLAGARWICGVLAGGRGGLSLTQPEATWTPVA